MPLTREGLERLIDRQGRTVKIERDGVEASVQAAVIRGRWAMRTAQLSGIQYEDMQTVIMASRDLELRKWPVPPKRHDNLEIDGGTYIVHTVYVLYIGDEVVGYRMETNG